MKKFLTEKQCWGKLMYCYAESNIVICRPTEIDSYLYQFFCDDIISYKTYNSMGKKTDDFDKYIDLMIKYDEITFDEEVSILTMFCGLMSLSVDRYGVIQ